jgi:hypothetical protein
VRNYSVSCRVNNTSLPAARAYLSDITRTTLWYKMDTVHNLWVQEIAAFQSMSYVDQRATYPAQSYLCETRRGREYTPLSLVDYSRNSVAVIGVPADVDHMHQTLYLAGAPCCNFRGKLGSIVTTGGMLYPDYRHLLLVCKAHRQLVERYFYELCREQGYLVRPNGGPCHYLFDDYVQRGLEGDLQVLAVLDDGRRVVWLGPSTSGVQATNSL